MNIQRLYIVLLILLTFSVSGCLSAPKKSVAEQEVAIEDSIKETAYADVFSKWSRGDKLFKDFEPRLHINATLKSREFRSAYAKEYAERFGFDADKEAVLLSNELDSYNAYNEFLVSTYTPSDDWNDFAEEDSIWQLYLVDAEGRRAEPVEIEELDKKDVTLREFFPYIDPWSKVYLVRFPRYDTSGIIPIGDKESAVLKLVITGIKAKGELTWDIVTIDE